MRYWAMRFGYGRVVLRCGRGYGCGTVTVTIYKHSLTLGTEARHGVLRYGSKVNIFTVSLYFNLQLNLAKMGILEKSALMNEPSW